MRKENKIPIASDHGAYGLKQKLIDKLEADGYEPIDMGCDGTGPVDYPDYAIKVATDISQKKYTRGILLCGTGIGMSIVANKFPGVRAALVHDHYTATMSRKHNDSNILVIGGRVTGDEIAYDILDTWLDTEYERGRHDWRLGKIAVIEKKGYKKKK